MKPETEMQVKKDLFMKKKREAVSCLRAMGAELPDGMDPCSWEGVMTMYHDVLANGSAEKRAAAGMAVNKWVHYHEECETMEAVAGAENILSVEMGEPVVVPDPEPAAEPPAASASPVK